MPEWESISVLLERIVIHSHNIVDDILGQAQHTVRNHYYQSLPDGAVCQSLARG